MCHKLAGQGNAKVCTGRGTLASGGVASFLDSSPCPTSCESVHKGAQPLHPGGSHDACVQGRHIAYSADNQQGTGALRCGIAGQLLDPAPSGGRSSAGVAHDSAGLAIWDSLRAGRSCVTRSAVVSPRTGEAKLGWEDTQLRRVSGALPGARQHHMWPRLLLCASAGCAKGVVGA